MQEMNPHIIEHGYIVIPKALLIEQFASCENREGEIEAFLKLLIKVNYTETKHTDYWHNTIMCKRGESLHSYRSWSVIFHWSTGKTYRFIQQLNAKGIIEIIPHDAATFLHIRVVNYESWTNALAFNPGKQKPATKSSASSGTTTTTSCSSPKRTSPRHSVSGKS